MIKELPKNWKDDAKLINMGNLRNVFLYNNLIVKEYHNNSRENLNDIDFMFSINIYSILNTEHKKYFLRHLFIDDTCLVTDQIIDFDDNISESLEEFKYKHLLNMKFYELIEELVLFLAKNDFYMYDLNPKNILIKRESETKIIPIFFDFKRVNRKYLFQPNLIFKNQRIKKVMRRLENRIKHFFN